MARFKMEQIKIDQFAVLSEKTNGELNISTSLSIGVNKELLLVSVQLGINYIEQGELKVILKITCIFSVHPDDWQQMQTGDKVILPKSFLSHLAMHTFGTARGIMYCKTENTQYQRFLLPPTNVDALIQKDLEA